MAIKRLLFPFISYALRRSLPASLPPGGRPDAPPYARRRYGVGTREFLLTDVPDRPLKMTLWYPAEGDPYSTSTYVQGPIEFLGYAQKDVPPLAHEKPYPPLIFSHGSGGIRWQSLFLTEHLASQGFVVAAVDHSGNTTFDAILAPENYEEHRVKNYIHRPQDVLRQIAYLEGLNAKDAQLAGQIDMEHIGVLGHSFGGYTALAVAGARLNMDSLLAWCDDPAGQAMEKRARGSICYLRHHLEMMAELRGYENVPAGLWPATTDPRIKAMVAMAPWNGPIFGREGLAGVQVPSLILVGSADPITLPERDAYQIYEHLGARDKALGIFKEGGHFLFVDECSELTRHLNMFEACSDPVWDLRRAHDLSNHLTTAFFLAKLYQDPAAQAALNPAQMSFVGLDYRQFETQK
jgi:predicted dienelactone hydrolase